MNDSPTRHGTTGTANANGQSFRGRAIVQPPLFFRLPHAAALTLSARPGYHTFSDTPAPRDPCHATSNKDVTSRPPFHRRIPSSFSPAQIITTGEPPGRCGTPGRGRLSERPSPSAFLIFCPHPPIHARMSRRGTRRDIPGIAAAAR